MYIQYLETILKNSKSIKYQTRVLTSCRVYQKQNQILINSSDGQMTLYTINK